MTVSRVLSWLRGLLRGQWEPEQPPRQPRPRRPTAPSVLRARELFTFSPL